MDDRSSGPPSAADEGADRVARRAEAGRWHARVDPDAAYERCARLEERLRDAQRAAAAVRTRAASREAASQEQLRKAKEELVQVTREAARARRQLAGVRRSASWRIGRLVLAPVLLARRASRTVLTGASRRQEQVSPAVEHEALVLDETSTDDLLARLAGEPTPAALRDAVARLWLRHGEIERPARLLTSLEHLLPDGDEALKILHRKILSAADVQLRGFDVPQRAGTPLYRARRRRVMYCVDATREFRTNGYTTRTQGVVAGVQDHAWDVVAVARTGFPWERGYRGAKVRTERRADGTVYVHCPMPRLDPGLRERIVVTTDAYLREARRQRPEVIHAASNHLTALPALIAARVLGVPFVYEVRGLWELTAAAYQDGWEASERYAQEVALETLVCREADAVVVITEQVADELVARGVDRDKVRVAPNGVDTDRIVPVPKDEEYAAEKGIDTEKVCLGYAGSLVDYEGLDGLVDAVAAMVARGIDVQLVLAGGGRCADDLRNQVERLRIGGSVRFLGVLPEHDMPRLLSLFDIVVCPRRSVRVTELVSPLKPLEAFAAGRAVVMSDVAPQRDLAGPGQSRALLFGAGDVEQLAATLGRLVDDRDLRARLGESGRRYVLDERRWATVAGTVVGAYAAAKDHHARSSVAARPLSQVRIGVIADEFTTQAIEGAVTTVALRRDGWQRQIADLDAVVVESAWLGDGGQWHRGVGRYSDAEFTDLQALVGACRDAGIPTVFFNKEDPVHTARFEDAALLCDVIMTVDADLVPRYLNGSAGRARWVGSLPFWANPSVHHPLRAGSGADDATVVYAGTFYGDRYPERSRVLEGLLEAAAPVGLAIYDRQASQADSPYRFPDGLHQYVRGSASYGEVVQAYKSHLAHISVNSVESSPTMFARRVVEIAASGGVVVSGPGRGVVEVFGPAVPVVGPDELADWLSYWGDDHDARRAEAWSQIRAVLHSHTAHPALGLVLRAAGVAVDVPVYDDYGLSVPQMTDDVCAAVLGQSLPPAVVYTSCADSHRSALHAAGIRVDDPTGVLVGGPDWVGLADDHARWGRHHFENLLLAAQWPGGARRLVPASRCRSSLVLAETDDGYPADRGLVRTSAVVHDVRDALVEQREFLRLAVDVGPATDQEERADSTSGRLASHDQHRAAAVPVT